MAAARKLRRSWPQRLTFALVLVAALACFGTAAGLATGQWVLSQRQLVDLATPESEAPDDDGPTLVVPGATTTIPAADDDDDDDVAEEAGPTTTIPLAEPDAANFLVVGADNGDCAGESNPTVGQRADLGERADTIMIWRANPGDDQLAVLSLPRDLYVDIAGGSKARINSAFRRNDPTRLVDTIYLNFGIPIDHYVQVDFCAFKGLVDAVGGVEVPFEFPARDRGSGLDIPEAGCVNLEGDMALAYVRSRKYQYEDPPGSDTWRTDGTSDFGRIARQQDFLRRVVAKVIDDGLYSPSVLTAMIETNRQYLVTDAGLTLQRMLEFGNTLRRLDAEEITTYRIESQSQRTADGSQVERPLIRNSNMQAILAVFKGEARLADAPDQTFTADDDGQDTAEAADTTTTEPDDDPIPSASTTLPTVEAEENIVGVAPTRDDICA